MGVGRTIGYSILALVDAIVPTLVVIFITGFLFVGYDVSGVDGWVVALAAGNVTFVLTLLASTISHYRGGSPFAFTRLAKLALHYFFFWPPWTVGNRRRRGR